MKLKWSWNEVEVGMKEEWSWNEGGIKLEWSRNEDANEDGMKMEKKKCIENSLMKRANKQCRNKGYCTIKIYPNHQKDEHNQ